MDHLKSKHRMLSPAQVAVSRAVRLHLTREQQSQADLARSLGMSESGLSRRLAGHYSWSVDDLDRLWDLGVPIDLPAYGEAAMAGADR